MDVSSALPDNNTPTSVAAIFISINGLRQSHNNWLIDGTEAAAEQAAWTSCRRRMPSPKFQALTSNYPAYYGISSSTTITLAFKSGSQHFQGELWEFNRNTLFDANNWFNKNSTPITQRHKLNYNIFGGNLGGPYCPTRTPERRSTCGTRSGGA